MLSLENVKVCQFDDRLCVAVPAIADADAICATITGLIGGNLLRSKYDSNTIVVHVRHKCALNEYQAMLAGNGTRKQYCDAMFRELALLKEAIYAGLQRYVIGA